MSHVIYGSFVRFIGVRPCRLALAGALDLAFFICVIGLCVVAVYVVFSVVCVIVVLLSVSFIL